MQTCTIYVVRHGESRHNQLGRTSGYLDTPLTDHGREQAGEAKANLAHIQFDTVYSSDLQRAAETAAIIYDKPVPKDHQLVELRERNFGELEDQPHALIQEAHERLLTRPDSEQRHYRYAPGAESDHELSERFLGALRGIGRNNPGKTVLVVAHAGCIRTLLADLGYASRAELRPGAFSNAGFVELSYADDKLAVQRVVGAQKQ